MYLNDSTSVSAETLSKKVHTKETEIAIFLMAVFYGGGKL